MKCWGVVQDMDALGNGRMGRLIGLEPQLSGTFQAPLDRNAGQYAVILESSDGRSRKLSRASACL